MAYHLQSLVRVIELILCHEKQHEYFDNDTAPQLQSLLEKACSLRDAFADHPVLSHQQDSFEDQIRDAAQNAEDVLETYVSLFATEYNIPTLDLQSLLESFDSIKDEIMKILDGDHTSAEHSAMPVVASSRIDRNPENIMVGMTDDLLQLKDRIFGKASKLEIIPIVGMGGIGKTTLARKLYKDSYVLSEFDARAWATISNDYSFRDILLGLLDKKRDEMVGVEDTTLRLTVYQKLKGRRYMVVLDDIWRSNAWDDVKKCFPNENKGSRIILTTRQSHVATYVDGGSICHQVRPLGKDDSWELLRKKVFGEETCPPELEKLGIRIANSCGGLPLAIQVIGGILSHTERAQNSWEQVARKVISAITNEEEQVSHILALSYNNLPYYLKPCFLYMSVFPEDLVIEPSTLLRLWITEGFLIPIIGKSLEHVAMDHIHALIDRNLIFVRERFTIGGIKTLGIHDLLRDLCVLEARKKKFFHVVNGEIDHNASRDMPCLRRVSVLTPSSLDDIYGSTEQKKLARSLLAFGLGKRKDNTLPHGLSTLRLLSGFAMDNSKIVTQAVNLRYLTVIGKQNPDYQWITTFRNLHFLNFEGYDGMRVPHELFEMPQLMEIGPEYITLCCDFKESSKNLVLQKNLHSLLTLEVSDNMDVVLAKFPNLKKFGLTHRNKSADPIIASIITCHRKIETLYILDDKRGRVGEVANYLMECSFADALVKFTLYGLTVPKEFMTMLGMLPNLEFLSLKVIQLEDTKVWKLSEGKFCRLKNLFLGHLSLVTWEADETHFPILMKLQIYYCYSLKELPLAIGEIPTLVKLKVYKSSPVAETWARQIQEEQLDYGNELLQVEVTKEFRMKKEEVIN